LIGARIHDLDVAPGQIRCGRFNHTGHQPDWEDAAPSCECYRDWQLPMCPSSNKGESSLLS